MHSLATRRTSGSPADGAASAWIRAWRGAFLCKSGDRCRRRACLFHAIPGPLGHARHVLPGDLVIQDHGDGFALAQGVAALLSPVAGTATRARRLPLPSLPSLHAPGAATPRLEIVRGHFIQAGGAQHLQRRGMARATRRQGRNLSGSGAAPDQRSRDPGSLLKSCSARSAGGAHQEKGCRPPRSRAIHSRRPPRWRPPRAC